MISPISKRCITKAAYPKGTRVRMTLDAEPGFRGPRTGVVVGWGRDGQTIRILRDGHRTVESWSILYWKVEPSASSAPSAVKGGAV